MEVEKPSTSKGGRTNTPQKQLSKDMEVCRRVLIDLENHESSWPFLVPVNQKQFPEYYKIIKHAMDFHTMKVKLRDGKYKSREQFASDARLVFFNCNTFNEDESEVGRAGKTMSGFFETRWAECLLNEVNERKKQENKNDNSKNDNKGGDNKGGGKQRSVVKEEEKETSRKHEETSRKDDESDNEGTSSTELTSSESESSADEDESDNEQNESKEK